MDAESGDGFIMNISTHATYNMSYATYSMTHNPPEGLIRRYTSATEMGTV